MYFNRTVIYWPFCCRGIAEVPENVSDAGSLGGEAPIVEAIVPTLGLGVACDIQVTALYQYRPTTEQHLSLDKGDTINVIEQQVNTSRYTYIRLN